MSGSALAIAIPTLARLDLLAATLASISEQTVRDIEVVVVDNASPLDVSGFVRRRFPGVCVVRSNANLFYAGAVNLGLRETRAPFVAALNDDVTLHPRWAEQVLTTFAQDMAIGAIATKVLQAAAPGLVDSAGSHLDIAGRATNLGWNEPDGPAFAHAREVFAPAGSCATFRRSAFEAAGGFDEDFVAYFEDVDLGFRMRLLGHRCVFQPAALARHLGGATPKPRRYALWLMERNMVWNLVKNMPSALLGRHAMTISAAQARPTPVLGGGSWPVWANAKASAWKAPRRLLAKRRRIQRSRRISAHDVERLLAIAQVRTCHL
jgi:GT2 family glycosyltransferase